MTRRSAITLLSGSGLAATAAVLGWRWNVKTVTILGAPDVSGHTYALPKAFENDHALILPATAPREGEVLKARLAQQHEIPESCGHCQAGSTWIGYWGDPE